MAATLTNPLALSKARVADLHEALTSRVQSFRAATTQRVEVATGTVLEGGLSLAYSAGATALDTAAKAGRLLPFATTVADELAERAATLSTAAAALQMPPISKYDDLNVREVADAIAPLSAWDLEKVRRYEVAHKNRKTVLGALERKLV